MTQSCRIISHISCDRIYSESSPGLVITVVAALGALVFVAVDWALLFLRLLALALYICGNRCAAAVCTAGKCPACIDCPTMQKQGPAAARLLRA
jgi:hypothetical protein